MAELRISDADRERAMADLARHYTDGRLSHEEYDERLDAIWTARTRADLAMLFEDLPVLTPPAPARPSRSYLRPRGRLSLPLPVPLLVIGALVAVALVELIPWWVLAIGVWIALAKLHRRSPRRAGPWQHGGCHGAMRRPHTS